MRTDQLQELETLESRATQGKWVAFDDCVMVDRPNSGVYIAEEVGIANGDFIAALRNAAARENARLRAVVEAARILRECGHQWCRVRSQNNLADKLAADRACLAAEADLDAALSALDAKGGG